jgi:hypothetical protein
VAGRTGIRAQDELVGAVGCDVEVAVVDVGAHRPVDATRGIRPVHRERDVALLVAPPGDAIGAIATDHRLLVERIRVVAEELARRRDDRREARALGVGLDHQLRCLGQQLRGVPDRLDGVEGLVEAVTVDVAVPDLAQQRDHRRTPPSTRCVSHCLP